MLKKLKSFFESTSWHVFKNIYCTFIFCCFHRLQKSGQLRLVQMWRKRTLQRLLRILRILCQVKRLPKTCVSDTRKTCLNQEFISYHVPTGRVGLITPLIWEIQYSLCFVRVCYSGRSCFSLNRRCFLTETCKIIREITAEGVVCDIFCQYFSIWCRKTMENSKKKKRFGER